MKLYLNSMEKVMAISNILSKIEADIDLISGRYIVDAKSILGILSLDLSKPIKVEFNGNENQTAIMNLLQEFAVE